MAELYTKTSGGVERIDVSVPKIEERVANLENNKLGKTEKAASALVSDSATKATQDGSGNVISSTYATKSDLTSRLADKADVSVLSTLIPKAGSRGVLQGYETQTWSIGNAVTIGYSTGDYITHSAENQTSLTITVDGGNIADLLNAGGVKLLFIWGMNNVKTLTVQGANGITRIDWEGDGAPSLSGKGTARLVFQLHDRTASISIKQWE